MSRIPKRNLGALELEVSVLGLGTNSFGKAADQSSARSIVNTALDLGVNFFDTADVYNDGESERHLGLALKGRRTEALIATKFGLHPDYLGGSAKNILRACDASLARLQTDYIDLYQMHATDRAVPIAETLTALGRLIQQGKVRHVGNSQFGPAELRAADGAAKKLGLPRFVSAQNRYNLIDRSVESQLLPTCEQLQLGFIAFEPLAAGLLSGKYKRGSDPPAGSRFANDANQAMRYMTERNFDRVEELAGVATTIGVPLLTLAIGYLIARSTVSAVIAGATSPDQVMRNVRAAAWTPTSEQLELIAGQES